MKPVIALRLARLYMRAGFTLTNALRLGWKNARS